MSADACVIYYGLRYKVAEHETEGLELRTDPRMVAARQAKLKSYWGNFTGLHDGYALLIGAELAVLGPENAEAFDIGVEELKALMDLTDSKLRSAGLVGIPRLYCEWEFDF
jgi:hypothetical protein